MNGLNIVRCSDNQVQVYQLADVDKQVISTTVTCDRKGEIYYNQYIGFTWNELKLICSSDDSEVHEEQTIERLIPGYIEFISHVEGQLDQSTEPYVLEINQEATKVMGTIISSEQAADTTYFNENTTPKERRIYIWFPDHPIICRLIFTSDEDNPCPSMHAKVLDDTNYACYYNPGAEEKPTIEQMEAELKQVAEADSEPDNPEAYVLDLPIPDSASIDDSDASDASDTTQHSYSSQKPAASHSPKSSTTKKSKNQTKSMSFHRKPAHIKSPEQKEGSEIIRIILLVLGILLLIGLICGVIYYIMRKYRWNNLPPSTNIENDGKSSYSVDPNQSQQSLTVTSAHETNTELSMNVPLKQKLAVKLQPPIGNIRQSQRVDTSTIYDENM
ncbi:unnamed protein product [Rotaria magnacalcarata]|uniref:Uncharacterized protein n=1 Tax=Rotaria magnacalcarata TaxID=392030 RepID=A0A814QBY4_9BILA|nr:unnamed protein product [Rotaria magnacalcarata]CAF1648468.1 unnamed protein product [Rotaria magnacalcarata]CAF2067875.1 unnamed protein product [Rotaria magnacalcarata]CAF2088248.1 unnamed protein product [Rotaria magnacalcarata]CAF2130552.1 unnamed protein product [Rotaria magnacalcarata]